MLKNKVAHLLIERTNWFLAVVVDFIRIKPKCTFLIVIISIILQVLGLAYFLLPLKMIFMLGMDDFKTIKLLTYSIESKKQLAIIIGILIGLLLLLTFSLEKYLKVITTRCSNDILNLTKKLQTLQNEQQLSKNLYDKVITAISAFVFTIVLSIVLIYVYPMAFVVNTIYLALTILSIMLLFNKSYQFRLRIENELPIVLNSFWMFGFLVIFIYVIIDFLSNNPSVTIIHALIFLILIRQMYSSITSFIHIINILYGRKEHINAIFFNNSFNQILLETNKIIFWQLFNDNYYKRLIPEVINKIMGGKHICINYEFYSIDIPYVACFILTLRKDGSEVEEKFLFKIFNQKQRLRAVQDIELYKQKNISDISVELVGWDKIAIYDCHLFKFNNIQTVLKEDFLIKRLELLSSISLFKLSSDLIKQYKNTHKLIYERLTKEMLIPIRLAALKIDEELIEWFHMNLDEISKQISTLPLRLVVPIISDNTLVQESNEIKLLSFHNWSIEPIGYMINENKQEQYMIKDILSKKDYDLVSIVQYMKVFEDSYNRFNFKKVIEQIRTIQNIYTNLPN